MTVLEYVKMPLILNVFGICKYALDSERDKNAFDLEVENMLLIRNDFDLESLKMLLIQNV